MDPEPIRILLVDDERNVLRSLERLFLDEEYEIFTAGSGGDGLEILEQHGPFRLVISDYRMSGMHGVEFLSEVCRRWPDTERMILSGYADLAAIVASINLGRIYKFIAKPWNDDDLLCTVREALERYELRARNRQLVTDLMAANEELRRINDHLNDMVDERVKEVLLKSRALHGFQGVVDALPIGVVGADGYGMVVQCNALGAEMLGVDREDLIGRDLATMFPRHLVQSIVQLDYNSGCTCSVELPSGACRAFLTRIEQGDQRAIVIALMKDTMTSGGAGYGYGYG
ncbi:response regulator [Pelobacter propionicus]|uniref:Putative PAS/PAC sensor protein n=1 Tax=Pelobacter propionicus (strain DSM 2379 / NBRC 103807 / OttBd1) TaxID=338966 RepID=A1ASK4_PELPD|nr:response regulator [Pelobacter propionicus]ABL00325.1 putative PAS/PAC sensor protein [Pelobacter propionicus DSM 2379]